MFMMSEMLLAIKSNQVNPIHLMKERMSKFNYPSTIVYGQTKLLELHHLGKVKDIFIVKLV